MKRNKQKSKFSLLYTLLGLVLFVYSVLFVFILFWGVINSFKTKTEFRLDCMGLPQNFNFENYITAFKFFCIKIEDGAGFRNVYFTELLINSVIYACGCAFVTTSMQCVAAYAAREFPCKFSSLIYTTVLVTMVIPIIGSDSSMLVVLSKLRLYDTWIGVLFMKSYFIGVYFLVFYSTFGNIPNSYGEAAMIDGAGNMRILFSLKLPLIKNLFLTIFLMNFISSWNDYQTPLLYLPSHPTVAYGVFMFTASQLNELSSIPLKLTGCMLLLLPMLVIFIIFSRRLMNGIEVGGIKE